ncbi:hypothetical protein HRbin06_00810 [archaeon HR06]|nr:hypothetical protein HRbin06_00810 [archaeon HR06]
MKLSLILHSYSYDRVHYGLSIALTGLAMGMEVHVLFTYGALKRLVKGRTDILGEGEMEERIEKALKKGAISSIKDTISNAKKMGLKIYACVAAMSLLNIARDELIEEVDEVISLSRFLDLAKDSLVLYI